MRRSERECRKTLAEAKEHQMSCIESACHRSIVSAIKWLQPKTIYTINQIENEKLAGTDVYSDWYRSNHRNLLLDYLPIINIWSTNALLVDVYNKIKSEAALDTNTFVNLSRRSVSTDSQSYADVLRESQLFKGLEAEFIQQFETWDENEAVGHLLAGLERPQGPALLPFIRRDLSARSGRLQDIPKEVSGAMLTVATTIPGVYARFTYPNGSREFPDISFQIQKLRA